MISIKNYTKSPKCGIQLALLVLLWALVTVHTKDTAIVHTAQGSLRGIKTETSSAFPYYKFIGIPYAKQPIGRLRFKAPEPMKPWKGVRNATKAGHRCPQFHFPFKHKYVGNEDCLFIDVFTPQLPGNNSSAVKPVVLWIHGGGFRIGYGSEEFYHPDNIVAQEIVMVTMNYRVGALGFLSTGDDVIPGNNGLKDQALGLRWIQQNIAQFGGNPHEVTIFGQSAGGVSTHLHMFSPMSKGLFHRVIIHSGSLLCSWGFMDHSVARKKAFTFGEALGCNTNDSKTLLICLKKQPPEVLLDAFEKVSKQYDEYSFLDIYFGPTTEPNTKEGEAFVIENPANSLKEGKFQDVPVIIGVTSNEAQFIIKDILLHPEIFESWNKQFRLPIYNGLNMENGTNKYKEVALEVKKFYFGNHPISMENQLRFIEMHNDVWFFSPAIRTIKEQIKHSTSPIYFYRFAFEGTLNPSWYGKDMEKYITGVCHSADLHYILSSSNLKSFDTRNEDLKTTFRMTKMWTNFIKTGNPTPQLEPRLGVIWEPVTATEFKYLNIDRNLTMNVDMEQKRMVFWEKMYGSSSSSTILYSNSPIPSYNISTTSPSSIALSISLYLSPPVSPTSSPSYSPSFASIPSLTYSSPSSISTASPFPFSTSPVFSTTSSSSSKTHSYYIAPFLVTIIVVCSSYFI